MGRPQRKQLELWIARSEVEREIEEELERVRDRIRAIPRVPRPGEREMLEEFERRLRLLGERLGRLG